MNQLLDPVVYWKFRALCADAQKCQIALMQMQESFVTAQKKQKAMLAELGLNPEIQTFQLNDDTLEIIFPES